MLVVNVALQIAELELKRPPVVAHLAQQVGSQFTALLLGQQLPISILNRDPQKARHVCVVALDTPDQHVFKDQQQDPKP